MIKVDSSARLDPLMPLLPQVRARLQGQRDTAALEAQVLLAHLLGKPKAWVIAHPEATLTPAQSIELENVLTRLEQGEPLPYVLGQWEFYGLNFWVTPATLIPRPETELLVERALGWLRLSPQRRLAMDVGSGTGCIAVSLAAHIPHLHLIACDVSLEALQVAQKNIHRHGMQDRVSCVQADLLPAIDQGFDLICANLPYIPRLTLESLTVSRWEPALALDGGLDGLASIRRLLQRAPGALAPGGLVLLEIEATQGAAALELARSAFAQAQVRLVQDLAGLDRLITIQT